MKTIIKFPKEKIQIVNQIQEAIINQDYPKIIAMKQMIIDKASELIDTDALAMLYEAHFQLRLFEDIIDITIKLQEQEIEGFGLAFYTIASYIALDEIYLAESFIRKYRLLQTNEIKYYYGKEEANYSHLLGLVVDDYEEVVLCLLMVNYVYDVLRELGTEILENKKILIIRFFDLINITFELGYDDFIIEELKSVMKIIFQIEV